MVTTKNIESKEILEELLDTEKLKYCFECGICTSCCPMAELLGRDYNPRQLLEKVVLDPKGTMASNEIWFCAWCYCCHRHCPQALKLPEIFLRLRTRAVDDQQHTEPLNNALRKIVQNIPLPLVATAVCLHPERANLEKKKILEKIEESYLEHLRQKKMERAQKVSEGKVAVIGSGPASLTVAYELSMKGYGVTVFEALPYAGGMLRKCIPESRLPREILEKEIGFIRDLGVEIKTAVAVGKDVSFSDLWRDGYKAVFVGAGAHKSQHLKIEGADLGGVVHALDFLWSVNSGGNADVGKKVVVIGGGNVAVDAAKTALCKGACEAVILYRRSREEMPAIPWEIKEVEEAGVKIELLAAPKRILGENGRVKAIECIRMQLDELDESGRRKPVPIEGSEFTVETDMVIFATGETPDLGFLPSQVELNEDGTVWVNPLTMETSLQGVFAGGDAVTGPATVIEAIRAGKCAARSIGKYLRSLGRET
ncbi:MAG: FAD-dependent oxidoreductase [Candidatus Bathyarchaeota archaeon]|nr:FAD-dependent oxidoreductase [Candidatus Bathyarchaeota archaeon]